GIVGYAADPGAVKFAPCGTAHVVGGRLHQHEFPARHFDLRDLQIRKPLDHFVHRKVVVGVGPDADSEPAGGLRTRAKTGNSRRQSSSEGSAVHRHLIPSKGAGRGVTSASTSPSAHLSAYRYIVCCS